MNTFLKIAVGCVVAPFVLAIVLVLVALVMRQAAPTAHRDETASLEQDLAGVTAAQLASEGLQIGTGAPAGRALPVSLRLEEGNFTIVPGPALSSIKVEGDYDAGAYELKQEMTRDAAGEPSYSLSFLPRYSMLRRIFTEGGVHIDSKMNMITIHLPRGVPMALDLRVSKGSSKLNLGGLAIQSAEMELSMGENSITAEEPNPMEMTHLKVNASMGESRLEDLGNLRAGEIEVWSKMGECRLDFGEKLTRDTKLYARMKMGEFRVIVPHGVKVKRSSTMIVGETSGQVSEEGEGPTLEIDTRATLGEVKYIQN